MAKKRKKPEESQGSGPGLNPHDEKLRDRIQANKAIQREAEELVEQPGEELYDPILNPRPTRRRKN